VKKRKIMMAMGAILALVVALPLAGLALNTTGGVAAAAAACTNSLTGSTFEIDPSANLKVDNSNGCIDWLAGGAGTQFRSGVLAKSDKPSGANDDSFGQGTAEDNPNPTIVTGSIPPNKSDLKAFGIYTEVGTATADNPTGKYLELFWSRVQNPSGTTNMDFELNQKFCDPSATPTNCANNGKGVTPETPVRTTGDKLITYDLSKGGTVPTISIRTWTGSAWGPATVISDPNNQSALGSVNTSTIPASETSGTNPALGQQDPYTFGEAAISFKALFSGTTCGAFGSAYLKSRSSDSFTSEIKDFVAPEHVNISNCSALTTDATQSVTIGSPISDTAHLTGVASNAGGTIMFHLYSDNQCTNEVTTGLSPVSVSGPNDYNSGNYTPTAVGTYYWTATYSGDGSNAGSSTACRDANESSVVNKQQPAISTDATATAIVGDPISDVAHLSGATADAGGSITFKLYGPNDADCSGAVAFTSTKPVSGNGDYTSDAFNPSTPGNYRWIASYSGDAKNLAVSGSCGDANEATDVVQKQPAISTTATGSVTIDSPISDVAHLSGATSDAGGTITFKLYSDNQCTNEVNAGLQPVQVNGNGDYNSGNFTPDAVGTYYWIASYSGDAKNLAVSGSCNDANESSVVGKANSNVQTAQSLTPQDSAELSAGAGGTPTGEVTFKLYGPSSDPNQPPDCTGTAVYTETVGLTTSGSASTSNSAYDINDASDGTYSWQVIYGGDTKHKAVTSCVEHFTVTITNGGIVTSS
jgi:hypothetical protein